LQAEARAHRIGQTKEVKVIRLIAKHTVEEIILQRANQKLKLTEQVIEAGKFTGKDEDDDDDAAEQDDRRVNFNPKELQELVKYGLKQMLGETEPEIELNDIEKIFNSKKEGILNEQKNKRTKR